MNKIKADLKSLSKIELKQYILRNKKLLGSSLIIPAHHYQRSEVVDISDFVGDSYKLAVDCKKNDAEFIVFCGVKFMAEGVFLLSQDHQKILMPDIDACCPMANMINSEIAERIYNKLNSLCVKDIIPVVYINSHTDMKCFAGKYNGSVCTSSNAKKVMEYYLDQDKAIFFSPDYNLGINTAFDLGIQKDEIAKINKDLTIESPGNINDVRLFIWDGFCYVHTIFNIEHIKSLRKKYPKIKIIVHPECNEDIIRLSDITGSTQRIYCTIANAPNDSVWGVGTEYNFVKRLDREFANKKVLPLFGSHCHDMEKIDILKVAESIQSIKYFKKGVSVLKNQISVPEKLVKNSKKALEKMIQISGD